MVRNVIRYRTCKFVGKFGIMQALFMNERLLMVNFGDHGCAIIFDYVREITASRISTNLAMPIYTYM